MENRTLAERFEAIRKKILIPVPDESLSEWAEKNFYLSRESAAEPGRIHFDRTPYLREIVDVMGAINTDKVVVMSSSQLGKTTALQVIMSYFCCAQPSPILWVMPTVEAAEGFSKERITPLIRDMPLMHEVMAAEKSRSGDNTILGKKFPGGSLTLIGANSPSSLSSRPIRILLCDEISRFSQSAKDEGNPLKLAMRRTQNFHNRKQLLTSTPGTKGICHVEREFEKSDQRHYHLPCKNCGDFFVAQWNHVKWESENHVHLPETARIECPNCGERHYDKHRIPMVRAGEWVAKYPSRKVIGFHLNALLSPWTKLEEMVQEWLDCQGKPEELRTFINTVLGQSFDVEKYGLVGIDNVDFQSRLEDYTPMTIPKEVVFVTAGVDVQLDRLECSRYGYAEDNEIYHIDHKVFHGTPSTEAVWKELEHHLVDLMKREDDVPLRVAAACVDSGGIFPQQAYSFCNAHVQRRWFAIKGHNMYGKPIFPKKVTRVGDRKEFKLYMLGVDTAKKLIYSWLSNEEPGPGYVHYSESVDQEFFDQLTAEKVKQKFSRGISHTVFILPKGRNNEALDVFVYSLAGRYGLSPNYRMIEINNLKQKGKFDEMLKRLHREPKNKIFKESDDESINKIDTGDSVEKKLLKRHLNRNSSRKKNWVNSW